MEGDDIAEIVVDLAKQQDPGGIAHLDHPERNLATGIGSVIAELLILVHG